MIRTEHRAPSTEHRAPSSAEAQSYSALTKEKRFALGMELLRMRSRSGEGRTHEEIAAWTDSSKSTIWRIEKTALAKAKRALAERGFSFPIDCWK